MLRSICLDIPHPAWVTQSAKAPPVALGSQDDAAVLGLIRQMGTQLGRAEAEIQQACNLAAGPGDIVVVLERPSKDHDYNVSFEDFVAESPTLKAIDELIIAATKAARSIYTVTVVDAYAFKPISRPAHDLGWLEPSDANCQALFKAVLELKQAKVILCCTSDRAILDYLENHFRSALYRAHHPGYAVNRNKYSVELRFGLLLDFIAAFRLLGPDALEYSVTDLKKIYRYDKSYEENKEADLDFAFVSRFHKSFSQEHASSFDGLRIEDVCRTWNGTSKSSLYSGGSLRIAEMILLLKEYRPAGGDLKVRQLQDALIEIGLKQDKLVGVDRLSIPELTRPFPETVPAETSSDVVLQESQQEIPAEYTGLSLADKQAIDERVRERVTVLIEEQAQVVVQQRIEEEIKRQVNIQIQAQVSREVEQLVQQEQQNTKEAIESASREFAQRILDFENATVGVIEQRLDQQRQSLQQEYQQLHDEALQHGLQQEQHRHEEALRQLLEEEQRRQLAEQQQLKRTLEEQRRLQQLLDEKMGLRKELQQRHQGVVQRLQQLLDEQTRLRRESQQRHQGEEQRLNQEVQQRLDEEIQQRVAEGIQRQSVQQIQRLIDQEVQQQLKNQQHQEWIGREQSYHSRPTRITVRLPGRARVVMPWGKSTSTPSLTAAMVSGDRAMVVKDETGSTGPGARDEQCQSSNKFAMKDAQAASVRDSPRISRAMDKTAKVKSQQGEVLPYSVQEDGQKRASPVIQSSTQQQQQERFQRDGASDKPSSTTDNFSHEIITSAAGNNPTMKLETSPEAVSPGKPSVKRLEFRFQNLQVN